MVRRALGVTDGEPHLLLGSIGEWHRAAHTHLPGSWLSRVFPSLPRWPEAYDAFAALLRKYRKVGYKNICKLLLGESTPEKLKGEQ